jgi:hypothetical protein
MKEYILWIIGVPGHDGYDALRSVIMLAEKSHTS